MPGRTRGSNCRRCQRARGATGWCLLAVCGLLGGHARPVLCASGPPLTEDGRAADFLRRAPFDQIVTVCADRKAVAEFIDALRRKYHLPLIVAPGVQLDGVRLTIRAHVAAGIVLAGIGLALGEDCRWELRDGSAVLVAARRGRWSESLPTHEAQALLAALVAAGLSPAGRPGEGDSPLAQEVARLDVTHAARDLAASVEASLGPQVLGEHASKGGVPIALLPLALQRQAFMLAVQDDRRVSLGGALMAAQAIRANPLVTGAIPGDARVRRGDGGLTLDYTDAAGQRQTVPLPGTNGQQ